MLKKIPKIISPDLLKILMEMGHGDEIVLADANYPCASHAQKLVSYPGIHISDLLPAIMELFPLDAYVEKPAMLMRVIDDEFVPPIWATYKEIIKVEDPEQAEKLTTIERPDFYEKTKTAYAIVATGEDALYGSIILRKGVC